MKIILLVLIINLVFSCSGDSCSATVWEENYNIEFQTDSGNYFLGFY